MLWSIVLPNMKMKYIQARSTTPRKRRRASSEPTGFARFHEKALRFSSGSDSGSTKAP